DGAALDRGDRRRSVGGRRELSGGRYGGGSCGGSLLVAAVEAFRKLHRATARLTSLRWARSAATLTAASGSFSASRPSASAADGSPIAASALQAALRTCFGQRLSWAMPSRGTRRRASRRRPHASTVATAASSVSG